jgi:hypothetical protein
MNTRRDVNCQVVILKLFGQLMDLDADEQVLMNLLMYPIQDEIPSIVYSDIML